MDLWDLTLLLLRRWYVAVPMLLASIAAVLLTAQGASPDYKSKGHLQMIPPPSFGKPVNPTAPARPYNPWLDLGYQALGNAVLIKVTDPPVLKQLASSGLSESVTVTLAERIPLLEIEAVGSSPEQATATVRRVMALLAEGITAEQKRYGVLPEDTITTLTLNDGASVEVVTSKVKRLVVVAGGLGLLTTTAGTIGFDALMRRRSRRREVAAAQNGAGAGPPRLSRQVILGLGQRRTPAGVKVPAAVPEAGRPPGAGATTGVEAAPAPAGPPVATALPEVQVSSSPSRPGREPAAPLRVEFKQPAGGKQDANPPAGLAQSIELTQPLGRDRQHSDGMPANASGPAENGSDSLLEPSDATIVLPLSHVKGWPWRNGKNNGR